jgi:hypothetical protein
MRPFESVKAITAETTDRLRTRSPMWQFFVKVSVSLYRADPPFNERVGFG